MTSFNRLVFLAIAIFVCSTITALKTGNLAVLRGPYQQGSSLTLQIRPKPCLGSKGHSGRCMFVWECVKKNGSHIGVCIDGFLFGTCCELKRNTTETHVEERSTASTILAESVNELVDEPEVQNDTNNELKVPIVQVPSQVFNDCGFPSNIPSMRIVGGKNSKMGDWPWQVSVRRIIFFGAASSHRCGGVVINEHYVLTAAHCITGFQAIQLRVRFGDYALYSNDEPHPHIERNVKKQIAHPNYATGTYENDVALLQIDQYINEAPNIRPICLPESGIDETMLVGREATITGWGRLSEGGKLPEILQQVNLPILSNNKCREMFRAAGKKESIPDMFVCAGFEKGGKDSCQGDSGGPLQLRNDDGRWFLVGIISWGISCAQPNLPGVSTRISKFKNWIFETISN